MPRKTASPITPYTRPMTSRPAAKPITPSLHNSPNLQTARLSLNNKLAHAHKNLNKAQARIQDLTEQREAIEAELHTRGVKPWVYENRWAKQNA